MNDSRPHTPRRRRTLTATLLTAILAAASSAYADSDSWVGATDSTWATSGNWLVGGLVPGSGNTATFNDTSDNTTIDLGAGVTIGSVVFDTSSAAAYTIGSGAVGSQTLTLDNAGAITINSGVTANQTFNSTVQLNTAANATATFTNNGSGTLTIAGALTANAASGNGVLNVGGSGNTTITGAVTEVGAGNSALKKTGSGTLTLSNGSTFNGSGASQSFGTGTNGNTAFTGPMIVQEGTLLLNGGAHTVTGEAVIGGIVAQGGAGQNAKIQVDAGSLAISSWLSIGRGNGVGGVSSDLVLNNAATVTAANLSAGFNGGNTANLPKGSITLNGTSSLSINAGDNSFLLGEVAGSDMTMTLNNSSTFTINSGATGTDSARQHSIGHLGTGTVIINDSASFSDLGTNSLNVGYKSGTGVLTLNGGTFTKSGEIRVSGSDGNGTFTGSGTVNVNGGTFNANALTLARNNDNVASTLTAAFNQTGGTTNILNGSTLVGWQGGNSTGTITVSGGTFNQGTTALGNMDLGVFGGAKGTVNLSGTGTLTLQRNSNFRFSTNAGNTASNSLNISGGSNMTFYSDAGTTVGGTGVIDLMNTAATAATNTINLNGGTLTANQIKATSASGTRVINFNGGTLKAAGSGFASTFLASGVATTANVRDSGAIIDTNGNNVTIAQALTHSAIGGDNATDGGLTKLGSGTLTLTGTNTYTGNTTISVGTLTLGSSAASATFLADTSSLYLTTGALLNLSFTSNSVLESISGLFIDGLQQSAGTWGALGSGANFESALITGTGLLNVTASAVPEPATYAAIVGALALGIVALRRQRASGRA